MQLALTAPGHGPCCSVLRTADCAYLHDLTCNTQLVQHHHGKASKQGKAGEGTAFNTEKRLDGCEPDTTGQLHQQQQMTEMAAPATSHRRTMTTEPPPGL